MVASGIDIIRIDRVTSAIRKQTAFLDRVYTSSEKEVSSSWSDKRKDEYYAGRFAAKEAVSKALGTGIGGQGVTMTDMEILSGENGAPYVVLHGRAKEVYEKMHGRSISISISHDGDYAVAVCCIEWEEE